MLNSTSAAANNPITTAMIGVIKPTNRQLAITTTVATISQPSGLSFADPMYVSV
ncbi:MAG TPA: hypothetical protein VFT08_03425 [Pyrinomonadaceae bacterium]|nr:hypothetical protein [Pyrinomonadaceae bacterium]